MFGNILSADGISIPSFAYADEFDWQGKQAWDQRVRWRSTTREDKNRIDEATLKERAVIDGSRLGRIRAPIETPALSILHFECAVLAEPLVNYVAI